MEKRNIERITSNHCARFFYGNSMCSGTVKNCSEKGMYIKTMFPFPNDSIFEVFLPLKEEVLEIPVKLIRNVEKDGFHDGMGLELLKLPEKYLELMVKPSLVGQI